MILKSQLMFQLESILSLNNGQEPSEVFAGGSYIRLGNDPPFPHDTSRQPCEREATVPLTLFLVYPGAPKPLF